MSLFRAHSWWEAEPDSSEEEAGPGCLVVANIDNDPAGQDKVVVGNFDGLLRIYSPQQRGYKIEDLMLEENLEDPILQLAAGKFIPDSQNLALAVLHSRRLVVYLVAAVGGSAKKATYFELQKLYSHKLQRTSYNLTYGPFGGIYGKDFICVQSMDGQLAFFEQDNAAFTRYLPDFLTPGPLAYVAKIDSFVLGSAAMRVECYKYQVLAAAAGGKDNDDMKTSFGLGLSATKKLQADWIVNIGEVALQLFVGRFSHTLSASQVDIVVLGEHSLFTLRENGGIRMQKRLDYEPNICVAYNIQPKSKSASLGNTGHLQHLLVSSFQGSLMIYRDTKLLWSAQHSQPSQTLVGVEVTSFAGVDGLIVTMDDKCRVSLLYLGTKPPRQSISALESKELDYVAMDEEHRQLLKVIRESASEMLREPAEKLTMSCQVPPGPEQKVDLGLMDTEDWAVDKHGNVVAVHVRIYVAYNGKSALKDVNISIRAPDGVHVDQRGMQLQEVKAGGTPTVLHVMCGASKRIAPSDLTVEVVAAYTTEDNEPRTALLQFSVPFSLVARAVPPLKNPRFLFTLDTNRSPPSLLDLFPDVLNPAIQDNPDLKRVAAQVMTVQYWGGDHDVTILVSKKAGRFRVQSGHFPALWLLTQQLTKRLELHFENDKTRPEPFQISYNDQLALADYFAVIDEHFAARCAMRDVEKRLEKSAHELRVIEKRLLVRFKDKNPAPLNHLDTLLRVTYQKLHEDAQRMEKAASDASAVGRAISACTRLLLLQIRYKCQLDDSNSSLLQHYLSPEVGLENDLQQGWEERTDASLQFLLRTALSKGVSDQSSVGGPLKPLSDLKGLKKRIRRVVERLIGGRRVVPAVSSKAKANGSQ